MTLVILRILEILGFTGFFRLLVFLAALIRFRSILFLIILAFLIILNLFTIHVRRDRCSKKSTHILRFHAFKRDTTE